MASRLGGRTFAPALRRVVHRQAHGTARRQFSSHTHGASNSGSGDTPWKIGSALIFIPTIIYLLSPSARSDSHKAHGAAGHDAHAESTHKTPSKSEATITDDEGTEVTVEEVKESIAQAVTQDAPKEAAQAEADAAESSKSDDGAPGQTSEAETANEQSEEPDDGTPQSNVEPKSSETPEQSIEVRSASLTRANR
jgi:hypothetical protein